MTSQNAKALAVNPTTGSIAVCGFTEGGGGNIAVTNTFSEGNYTFDTSGSGTTPWGAG